MLEKIEILTSCQVGVDGQILRNDTQDPFSVLIVFARRLPGDRDRAGISSIVDNLILMNFVELGNSLRRAITVAKARGSAHEFVTREYTIGPGGINLVPIEKGKALPVLPFQSYYGLLSRAPARLSPDLLRGERLERMKDEG